MGSLILAALAIVFVLAVHAALGAALASRRGWLPASAALLAVAAFPLLALAQHAPAVTDALGAEQPLSTPLQLGASVYQMLAPILVVLTGWIAKRLSDWLSAHTKNAAVAGILTRMNDQVWTLVKDANQTLAAEIRKAKDPKSPGGDSLTTEEAASIKRAVLGNFRDLWGAKGLMEAASVLGLSGESGVMDLVAKKVEAAVHDLGAGDAGRP